jgi:hypothetical protein
VKVDAESRTKELFRFRSAASVISGKRPDQS